MISCLQHTFTRPFKGWPCRVRSHSCSWASSSSTARITCRAAGLLTKLSTTSGSLSAASRQGKAACLGQLGWKHAQICGQAT